MVAAGDLARLASMFFAASCAVFGVAGAVGSEPLVSGVLVLGAAALATGEVGLAASRWSLSLGLAPEHRRPDYLVAFNLGLSAEQVFGPALVTMAVLRLGAAGWLGLAVVFLLAAAGVRALARTAGIGSGSQLP